MIEVFDRIYRENLWNGEESRSGPGSGDAATRTVSVAITDLVTELGITSVLDLGCGDGYWMPDLPGYLGADPSSEAIARARMNHPDRAYTNDMPFRYFGLVIVRDVIQHLPLRQGARLLRNARIAAMPGWLLASTYVGGENVDIEPGMWYSPDLTRPPFGMPQPDRLLFDGYHYHETDELRDPTKHLGLWRIG